MQLYMKLGTAGTPLIMINLAIAQLTATPPDTIYAVDAVNTSPEEPRAPPEASLARLDEKQRNAQLLYGCGGGCHHTSMILIANTSNASTPRGI